MSRVYLTNWGKGNNKRERYVYYDSATKKRIYGEKTQFEDIKDFKNYIQTKSYLIGVEQYKKQESNPKIGKNIVTIESKELDNRGNYAYYRIIAYFKYRNQTYTGTSSIIKKGKISDYDLESFKDQCAYSIASQIFTKKMGFAVTDPDKMAEIEEDSEFIDLFQRIKQESRYTYVYASRL